MNNRLVSIVLEQCPILSERGFKTLYDEKYLFEGWKQNVAAFSNDEKIIAFLLDKREKEISVVVYPKNDSDPLPDPLDSSYIVVDFVLQKLENKIVPMRSFSIVDQKAVIRSYCRSLNEHWDEIIR